MPIVSFKDFTPVQYTGGESEMQDRYAYKRKKDLPMDEEATIGRIRDRMHAKGLRRKKRIAERMYHLEVYS